MRADPSGFRAASRTSRKPGTRFTSGEGGDTLVDSLPGVTLVVGKGGVGKTTCASALALRAARRIGETLVLSTDPARALPTVLAQEVGTTPTRVRGAPRLRAQALDAGALRARFLERWGTVIGAILDRGTYLDESDIAPLVDTALPGSDEIFAALELATLMDPESSPYDRVIVDTAPTGHTLRLLDLPRTFRALVRLLDAMQAKHRFMVRTLTRTYRADEADAFISEMNRLVSALESGLSDERLAAAVLVTNTEPLVQDESRRYLQALRELNVHVKAVVWNATGHPTARLGDVPQYVVPRLEQWPIGTDGLERWLAELQPIPARSTKRATARRPPPPEGAPPPRTAPSARRSPARAPLDQLLLPLTIVAGKGGVGKTTVSCVLALHSAVRRRTLVVSTDPAPSLGDALAHRIADADTAVPSEASSELYARQMDATAAFARLRDEYQTRVDALFQGLVARGVDLSHDRVIARDLLSLAPPGIDEVYALSLLADALLSDRYACVVVDPAPTGHLLRLLEMPQLALTWCHQLMRLMLKYKDVTGLGETAQELLSFSRSLRAVDALLHDPSRCGVVVVTLDEPVVREETERLAAEIRRHEVHVVGVVLNRATGAPTLPVAHAPVHFEAPVVEPAPIGSTALRKWASSWRVITDDRTRHATTQEES